MGSVVPSKDESAHEDRPFDQENHQIISRFVPKHTEPIITCYNCGNAMKSNGFSMCNDCIGLSVDITADCPKTGSLTFCKNCGRIQVPPNKWVYAERESRELLAICLKRLKSYSNDKRFIDAKFIWTEPHSRRTKIKITLQGEAAQFNNLVIQQSYVVEFRENTGQCPDCAKSFTANTWTASIQIRQKVQHKKTFLYLEQLILKRDAHKDTVSISEGREGLDFFYSSKNDAVRMIDFLVSTVPVKVKKSEQLISQNTHTAVKKYKFTYSVEIAPICREDLVALPKKVARMHGNISPVTICYKINNQIHLIDPKSLQTTAITASEYWKAPFKSVATAKTLTEFIVLDIEPTGAASGRFALADVTIARASDLGHNDKTYYLRTHMGGIVHPGDTVMGYDLTTTIFNHDEWEQLKDDDIPDIILIKKVYPDKPKNKKRRLKRMAKEYNEDESGKVSQAPGYGKDYEEFLDELVNDPDLQEELGDISDEDSSEAILDIADNVLQK